MTGHVALVTGAGSEEGIGFAAARVLVGCGARVAIVATSERIHDRAIELGDDAIGIVADLTDPDAVDSMFAELFAWRERLDIVVNNAGMTSVGAGTDAARPLEELSLDEWHETIQRNLGTAFLVCRSAVPIMREAGYGRIVNVASTSGPVSAFTDGSAYASAKAGMVGMTRALAIEVARAGITVNAVAPGWIDTASASESERRAGAASPIGRSGTADEVAGAIAFLASPAASYITGTTLVIDGGNAIAEDHAPGGRVPTGTPPASWRIGPVATGDAVPR
ncbi:MAG: short-chain dehydrogenase [Ilumatobacteraceae bacterium]|nr:short-chain dehydrogenase [Ilumatobacteraceae bacterium]